MKPFLVAWLGAIAAFVVVDGLWLGLIARDFYADRLGELLRRPIRVAPAAAFYLCYTAGLVFLAVRPSQPGIALGEVALYGALVGFLAYGTYDMTNLSTLRDWPVTLAVVDIVWGTALSAAVATFAAFVVRRLL